MVMFSIIVPTKKRPSLVDLLNSIKNQTFKDYEIIIKEGKVNEYFTRNEAAKEAKGEIFVFLDDDTIIPTFYLQRLFHHFQNNKIQIVTCPLVISNAYIGTGVSYNTFRMLNLDFSQLLIINKLLSKFFNILNKTQKNRYTVLDYKYSGYGTTISIRKSVFEIIGGFKVNLYENIEDKSGWRLDTIMLFDTMKHFGVESHLYARDIFVYHPQPIGSKVNIAIEIKFYNIYKDYVDKYILPYDYRLRMLIDNIGKAKFKT